MFADDARGCKKPLLVLKPSPAETDAAAEVADADNPLAEIIARPVKTIFVLKFGTIFETHLCIMIATPFLYCM